MEVVTIANGMLTFILTPVAIYFVSVATPLLQGPLQETIAKPKKKKEKTTVLLDSDIEDNSESDEEDNKDAAGNKITARTPVPDHLPPFPSKHSYRQTAVRTGQGRSFLFSIGRRANMLETWTCDTGQNIDV